MRTPRLAIVAATEAMPSGVALSLFWPIADAPTASASLSLGAFGIVLIFAAGSSGCLVEAEASRPSATSRLAPTLAPIGPKTLLQECANEFGEAAAARSSQALRSLTPDSVANCADRIGARHLGDAVAQAGGGGDDLEARAGRLGRGDREAGEREHGAVAGLDHRDAADLAAQRVQRGASAARAGSWCGSSDPCGPRCWRSSGRRSAATSCGARRGGRCRCAPGPSACRPRRRRSTRPSGRSPAACRRRRRCCRGWARRRCGGGPPRPCARRAARCSGDQRDARDVVLLDRVEVIVPRSVPKSLVFTDTGTFTSPPLSSGPSVPIVTFCTPAARLARR